MDLREGKKLFFVICAGYFTFGLLNTSIGPLLEQFADNNSVSVATIGSLLTALFTGGLLAQLLLGPHMDNWGQHRWLAVSFLVMPAFLTAATFTRFYPLTVGLFFLAGLGYGTAVLTGNTVVTRIFEENSIAPLNWLNVFFGVGDVVGPLLVSFTLSLGQNGMTAIWIGSVMMALIAGVLLLSFYKTKIGSQPVASAASTGKLNLSPFLISLIFLVLTYVGTEIAVGNWTTTYLHMTASMAVEKAALATSGFWLALTLGRLMGALTGNRLGANRLLILSFGISSAGAVLFILGFGHVAWSIAAVMVLGLGFGAIFPTLFGLMSTTYKQNSSKPGSLLTATASLSGMALPWLVGITFTSLGIRSMTFFVAGLILLLWIGLYVNLKTRKKNPV